jgi:hypothetical protein
MASQSDFFEDLSKVHPNDYHNIAWQHADQFDEQDRSALVADFVSALLQGYCNPLLKEGVPTEKIYMAAVYTTELFIAAFHQLYSDCEGRSARVEELNKLLKL